MKRYLVAFVFVVSACGGGHDPNINSGGSVDHNIPQNGGTDQNGGDDSSGGNVSPPVVAPDSGGGGNVTPDAGVPESPDAGVTDPDSGTGDYCDLYPCDDDDNPINADCDTTVPVTSYSAICNSMCAEFCAAFTSAGCSVSGQSNCVHSCKEYVLSNNISDVICELNSPATSKVWSDRQEKGAFCTSNPDQSAFIVVCD